MPKETNAAMRTVGKVSLPFSVILVILFVLIALNTSYQMTKIDGSKFPKVLSSAPYDASWSGIDLLDQYTFKLVHHIFVDHFLLKPINFWFLEVWMMPCLALIFFQQIDFSRLSMRFVPFYMFLIQYFGIGLIWPITMIYYLYKRNSQSVFQGGSSPARVVLSGCAAIFTMVVLSTLPTLSKTGSLFFWAVNAFLLIPVILPLFSYILPSETAPRSVYESAQGQRFENLIYAFMAGISFLMYWKSLPSFIEYYFVNSTPSLIGTEFNQEAIIKVLSAGFSSALQDLVSNDLQIFLLYDCAASIAVILLFIWLDSGLLAAFLVLAASPLISPGTAVAIYLLRRESIIYGKATGTWTTKIEKKKTQ